jgi:NAD(P)-dependent dehydrogenase (short-subunit alcohol dehydrogenase family)
MPKKLEGKIAVITGATSGMALATAKLFVEEGAYVFITGRRQEQLDHAVKEIGSNVTGVQGDAGNLADLDRLYETVKAEKGHIDILYASAGTGDFNVPTAPSRRRASTRPSMSTYGARCSRFRKRCH